MVGFFSFCFFPLSAEIGCVSDSGIIFHLHVFKSLSENLALGKHFKAGETIVCPLRVTCTSSGLAMLPLGKLTFALLSVAL